MCPEEMKRFIKEAVDNMDDTTLEQLYWMIMENTD